MSKKYKAIMFDLDGTLLPMDMKVFSNGYFVDLNEKCKDFNFDLKEFISAVWSGTHAMMKNDGSVTNRDAFWKRFEEIMHVSPELVDPVCLDFYQNEFKNAVRFTSPTPKAKIAVETAREKADLVILATNPLFPMVGQITRLSWLDLKVSDFDLVTSYEEERFCKPNPQYFVSVMERMNLKPSECLMIGNDEYEDMFCASSLGIDCYLITDTMIENPEHHWDGPRGTYDEMLEMLKSLP